MQWLKRIIDFAGRHPRVPTLRGRKGHVDVPEGRAEGASEAAGRRGGVQGVRQGAPRRRQGLPRQVVPGGAQVAAAAVLARGRGTQTG